MKVLSRYASLPTLAAIFMAASGVASIAQTASYSVNSWTYDSATDPDTIGYTFIPTANIVVTSLGEWVPVGGTINGSESVGMFNASGLMFSTGFTQASATIVGNTLVNGSQFRYVDITSLFSLADRTLSAGQTYTMAGTILSNPTGTNAIDLTAASGINITSSGLYNSGDTISGGSPLAPATTAGYNMYGVNFEFVASDAPASTPEPGSIGLIAGLASTGAFAANRRRKQLHRA